MDLKDSKTQKLVLGGLAFLIVVYFWYSRLFAPYSDQLEVKETEFETITTNLKTVELKAKSLDALKMEYEQLVDRYNEIESLLPEEKRIPNFLAQLHNASSQTGTKIKRLHPQPIKSESFYNVVSFEVELTGTYHDFGRFISYVANFPFITNVSDVEITAQKLAISKSAAQVEKLEDLSKRKETVTAKFMLSTYFVKASEHLAEITL